MVGFVWSVSFWFAGWRLVGSRRAVGDDIVAQMVSGFVTDKELLFDAPPLH